MSANEFYTYYFEKNLQGDIIGVSSLTINLLKRQDKLTYDYYSYPWEAETNNLGGSTLSDIGKSPLPKGGYTSYWDLIVLFF